MHDRKCRLRVNFQSIIIIITYNYYLLLLLLLLLKKYIVSIVSYSIDAHLDNYNKRMSSLKERILGDKYIDCYYHPLFIVIIVITCLYL